MYRGSALQSSIGKSRILLLFEFNIVPVPKSMILTESICVHIRTWNSDRSKFHAWQKFMAEWTHWNSSFEFGDRDRAHRNAGNLGIWYLNENAETKIVATLLISIWSLWRAPRHKPLCWDRKGSDRWPNPNWYPSWYIVCVSQIATQISKGS